jgi:hypothetical protein
MKRRPTSSGKGGMPSTSAAAEPTSTYAAPGDSTSIYATAASLAGNILANLSQNLPLNLIQFPFQNPNSNFTFAPNPALLLQNPGFLPNPNPNANPSAVLPNPNAILNAIENPNESSNAQANGSRSQKWLLKKATDLTKQAHEELLSAGECVSGYKVARNVLASLGTGSWEPLGIQMKDVPPLQQIFQMEGRVSSSFAPIFT